MPSITRALTAALTLSLAVALTLTLAATALAAPAKTPGVAFVKATQTVDPEDGDPEGDVAYQGATGPPTGNMLTVVETGNQLDFTAPLTLMLPSPFAQDQVGNCTYGLGHARCTIPGVYNNYGYPSGCTGQVVGNKGADHITMRSGPAPDPYTIPTDCWYIFFYVATKDGNDVIKAHDNNPTSIACGAGYDTVIADSYDAVARDCEVVGRA